MSRSFKSIQSIQNYISGVKLLHLFKGIEYPQFDSFHLRLVLKGLARDNPHCPKQACPITPEILLSLLYVNFIICYRSCGQGFQQYRVCM